MKLPTLAMTAALLLSACVDPFTGQPVGTQTPAEAPAPAVVQAPVQTDPTIYAARSDGQFTVPALPVEQIPETFRRQVVAYPTTEAPGTIIIDPAHKVLYYVTGKNEAIRYGISVGAEGFQWSGTAVVANKRTWPTWTPPAEMIARKPHLEKWRDGQPGGPSNPLGSRAIYLTTNGIDYGYRIHGTPEWKSIGRNASSGCFRMINQDVMDLYDRVQGGEKVIVLTASGQIPTGLSIPKPPAPKKKAPAAAPKPAEATPAAGVPAPALEIKGPPPALGGAAAGAAAPATTPAAASPVAPGALPPALNAAPAAPAAAPAVPAAPAAPAVAPAAPAAPAAAPAPAATPACAVPLVNGSCPK